MKQLQNKNQTEKSKDKIEIIPKKEPESLSSLLGDIERNCEGF